MITINKTNDFEYTELLEKFREYKKTNNEELRNELITKNIKLANYFINAYSTQAGISINDIESYAYEGLIKAVETFDPYAGYKFSTYAKTVIFNCINSYLHEVFNSRSYIFWKTFVKVKKQVENNFDSILNNELEIIEEVFEKFRQIKTEKPITKSQINKLLLYYALPLEACETKKSAFNIEKNYEKKELNILLNNAIEKLNDRESQIVKMYYGLDNNAPKTLYEIGNDLKISKTSVHKMKEKCLKKIKKELL